MSISEEKGLGLDPTAEEVSAFIEEETLSDRVRLWLRQTPAAVPLVVLLCSLAIFGLLLGGKFFSPFALTLILQQVAIVGIVALAQSLVILTAGIDLSVGAIMVFSSVINISDP